MKKTIIIVLLGWAFCVPSFAQSHDHEAVKAVCQGETRAYLDHIYEAWAALHTQLPEDQLIWSNPDGTYGTLIGWEALSKEAKGWFQDGKKSNATFANSEFTIVIKGDMAFAAYTSNGKGDDGKAFKSRESRTLLKVNGQWKILAVQAFVDYKAGQ